MIERAEALGEPLEDPLLLFSVLYGFWVANYVAFNGDVVRELAAQFLAFAEKQRATVPLMIGHRLMGISLLFTGEFAQARMHLDQALALYDPASHRPLATRFGQDVGVAILSLAAVGSVVARLSRSRPTDTLHAIKDAREIGQAATLMYALNNTTYTHMCCRDHVQANAQSSEVVALADEKGAVLWKALGMLSRGCVFALSGKAADAVQIITSGIAAVQSTGTTVFTPVFLAHLATAHAQIGQFTDAWRCIGEAVTTMETTKERWFEAEVHCMAGEIALLSPPPDAAKAEAYFERALAVARQQQAKSWELRAAMSMARLWRDQGKRDAGPRTARSGLRVVHRRLRHARSEGGQGFARRVARLTTNFETAPTLLQCMSPLLAPRDI